LNRQGEIQCRLPSDFKVHYRHVEGPKDEWFIGATFQFKPGDKKTALARIKTLLEQRAATQPTGEPTCGSVFRNPPGDYAARLIEACGLKGYTEGGAQVSTKHANFIINTGIATTNDIERLIDYIAQQVKHEYGIELIREVKIVGNSA
jgi:UDP-N-acetylmuramate dehydrogenase